MGTFYYGGSDTPITVEDRTLAHLKVLIASRLRRGEGFTLSWRHPDEQPRGRTAIWLHPSVPLRFVFDTPDLPSLDREWLEQLANSVNLSGGIELTPEPFHDGDSGVIGVVEGAPGGKSIEITASGEGAIEISGVDADAVNVTTVDSATKTELVES